MIHASSSNLEASSLPTTEWLHQITATSLKQIHPRKTTLIIILPTTTPTTITTILIIIIQRRKQIVQPEIQRNASTLLPMKTIKSNRYSTIIYLDLLYLIYFERLFCLFDIFVDVIGIPEIWERLGSHSKVGPTI